ncbi:MAG: type II toxin-antitoxin system RelE/ParE family toxin [Bacteroidetes bacterium]|nr:type II toxin-antitoxin system RelE/ParE family toxin [Bacteroidota bacterium]
MKVVFTKTFQKDYNRLLDKKLSQTIAAVIAEVHAAHSIQEIAGIKKLEGSKTAYRVRVGNYRIGLFVEKDTAIFAIFEHRSKIYKKFP